MFTHYTTMGATLIDRFYISQKLRLLKIGMETMAAAFTDHFAIK
jgi:hypothetical protein